MRNLLLLLAISFLLPVNDGFAQRKRKNPYVKKQRKVLKRETQDIFPDEMQYKMGGWHFAPGLTYMLPPILNVFPPENQDTSDPKGKLGLYLEAGRYNILKYSTVFKYLDYGIAYKSLRGKDNGQKFGDHFLLAHFNLNHVWQLTDYSFIQNTLGANADYSIIRNVGGTTPPRFIFQLHYKFGYGFLASKNLILIPSIETPILNGLPWERGRSSLGYYNSRYRPLIFSIRFLFLKPKREKACIPVPAPDLPDGYKIPTDMEEDKK